MYLFVIITTIIAGISVLIALFFLNSAPSEQFISIGLLLFAIFLLLLQGPIKVIFG